MEKVKEQTQQAAGIDEMYAPLGVVLMPPANVEIFKVEPGAFSVSFSPTAEDCVYKIDFATNADFTENYEGNVGGFYETTPGTRAFIRVCKLAPGFKESAYVYVDAWI